MSSTVQATMVITYMQKNVEIKSNNVEHSGDHLHVEEGEDQVKPNPAHHDAHLHAEEGEESQSPPRTACGSPA